MIAYRLCSKIGCSQPAIATLTYSHAEQTAYLGPIVAEQEPHKYDLCRQHSQTLTPPRGWEIVRQPLPGPEEMELVIAQQNPARDLGVRRAEDFPHLRRSAPEENQEQEWEDEQPGEEDEPFLSPEEQELQEPARSSWLPWGRDR